jgi:putative methionine-R-sulfoxide reductase with GAF domain
MDQNKKNTVMGKWIFAFLTVSILATICAAQAEVMVLMFVCAVTGLILSFGLLILLMQTNKALDENIQEVVRLKQRENNHLKKKQRIIDDIRQHTEVFNADEAFARIKPAAGTDFESIAAYTEKVLQNIAKEMDIVQGLVFVLNDADQLFHISGQYAYYSEEQPHSFPLGETLSGQVAKNRKLLNLKEIPDNYIAIISGLGKSSPQHLVIAPIVCNGKSIGIIELASFKPFGENEESLICKVNESMANLLNELRN